MFFSAALRSLPPGHQIGTGYIWHVAGACVIFWHQLHSGRLVHLEADGLSLSLQVHGDLNFSDGHGHAGRLVQNLMMVPVWNLTSGKVSP